MPEPLQLDGYTDLTKINRGGMATIYRGHQTSLNRTVAIKFLSAEHLWDGDAQDLFEQESLVIAQLNHPNIIHIIDRGFTQAGRPYFVLEYIEGQTLEAKMQQTAMTPMARVKLSMQICSGLAYAHKNGIVHRDIKPANLLIDNEGHLKILDFGIAWFESHGNPDDSQILGTPDYMSPEQFTAPEQVNHLTDIYSLGAVMYQLFTGRKQVDDITGWQTHLETLKPKLATLIRQCLEINPDLRPTSAEEVRLRLLRILQGAHLDAPQRKEASTMVGRAIDNFTLLDVVSRNRFGAAYLFEDRRRNQLMVIKKRIKTDKGLTEARKLIEIRHNNLVEVLGTSKNEHAFIVVMQHMDNGSLQERLSRPYAGDRFIEVALQMCRGMQAAHGQNVLHGNLRPSNVLFDKKERIRISDFGFEEHYASERKDWYQPRLRGQPSVERDIYAMGAIFHHMLAGEPLRFAHRRIQSCPGYDHLDDRLQSLLRDMLQSDSEHFLDTFENVITRLESLKGALPQSETQSGAGTLRKIWKLAVGILLLGLAGMAAWQLR